MLQSAHASLLSPILLAKLAVGCAAAHTGEPVFPIVRILLRGTSWQTITHRHFNEKEELLMT